MKPSKVRLLLRLGAMVAFALALRHRAIAFASLQNLAVQSYPLSDLQAPPQTENAALVLAVADAMPLIQEVSQGATAAGVVVALVVLLVASGVVGRVPLQETTPDTRADGAGAPVSEWEKVPLLFVGFPPLDPKLIEAPEVRVGHNEFVRLIGRGHGLGVQSVVYESTNSLTGERESVKVIPKRSARCDAYVVSGILDECELMEEAAHHPNVADFHRFLHGQENLYIIYAFAEGKSLGCMLRDAGPLSIECARELFVQVASAVSHCHARGLAHLDLKPDNVVVAPDGRAKLIDFGQAVRLGRSGYGRRGTMAYAALEVITGDDYEAAAADVWSLGVLLLDMLDGNAALPRALGWEPSKVANSRPENGALYAEDVRAFISTSLRAWLESAVGQEVPEALSACLHGALHVEPAQRWNAADVAAFGASPWSKGGVAFAPRDGS